MEVWFTPWGGYHSDYITNGGGEMEAHCNVARGHVVSKKDFETCLGLGHSLGLQSYHPASGCEAWMVKWLGPGTRTPLCTCL